MSDAVERGLLTFHSKATAFLPQQPPPSGGSGKLIVLSKVSDILLEKVAQLEESDDFRNLRNATRNEFPKFSVEKQTTGSWDEKIKTFLRMSGYYLDVAEGRAIEKKELTTSYRSAFSKPTIVKRYLAPIEFVSFLSMRRDGKSQVYSIPPKGNMHFSGYSIRSFSAIELDQLLNQHIMEVFYPWANVNTRLLSEYWFIDTTEIVQDVSWQRLNVSLEVEFKYSRFPAAIENAMSALVLYNWAERESQATGIDPMAVPACFHIPFVLTVTDSLIERPESTPTISVLARQPVIDQTGEEIGDEPVIGYYVDHEGEGKFKAFMERVVSKLNDLRGCPKEWRFLHVGLGFLVKASASKGLEQLLWHIAAIEAFLGEKGSSTYLLVNRLATVIGRTDEERKHIKKVFRHELYDIRSDIVHGKVRSEPKLVFQGHLEKAQEYSRTLAFWMVNYLHHIHNSLGESPERFPTREEVLSVLDRDQTSRKTLQVLLNAIPDDFPNVTAWE